MVYVESKDVNFVLKSVELQLIACPDGRHFKVGRYIPFGQKESVFYVNSNFAESVGHFEPQKRKAGKK